MSPQEESESSDVAAKRTAHVQAYLDKLLQRSAIYNIFMTGTQLTNVTPGTVTTQLVLTPTHVNSKGGLHGAVSAAIIDFVTGLAIVSWDLREETGASVDMHISYLSSKAGAGDTLDIVATAEKVEDDGERTMVTLGQHTKFVRRATKVQAVAVEEGQKA
ncbi:hypothetical protein PT974_08001 [Cladobotryum mycophilum]|uniref:Thioesterase domain-containing protein n=1 Tax=Cladobotryum mycophilum TaxID=491253 RepID=A0ABR0SC34_9HYPO